MSGFWISYVIISIACLLLFLLISFIARILYKRRTEKKLPKVNSAPVIRAPEFRIPVFFRTVDAQTPVCQRLTTTEQNENSRKGRKTGFFSPENPSHSESNIQLLFPEEEHDVDVFKSSGAFGKRRRATETGKDDKKWQGISETRIKKLSLPASIDMDTLSCTGSAASFSSTENDKQIEKITSAKGRQRRISVTVFQHLKTEGKKISQSQPSLLEEDKNEALAAALAAAESKSVASDTAMAAESGHMSEEEMKTASEPPLRGVRRRVAARRWQEQRKFIKAGKICFTTKYNLEQRNLEVTVLRAFDLGKRKEHNFINPFVRLYLVPGKRQKQHTRVQRKTKEPFFNDKRMFYDLSENDLVSHRLRLKVYSREAIKKNELLGEAEIALGSLKLAEKETFSLDLHMTMNQNNGQILISLLHDAAHSKLKVMVHKAKELPKLRSIGLPDTYCRILFCRESEWEKKETKIKRNSRNPTWDETHVLDVATNSSNPLNMMSLVITVISHSLMGTDEILGHVIFCLDSIQKEAVEHWRQVEESPHSLITRWHNLIDPEELEHSTLSIT